MWVQNGKEALWGCCVWPVKILVESVRVVGKNKVVFCCIACLTTLPLSLLLLTLAISSHTIRSHIFHLEAVARLATTRVEARHVWHESRHEAVSLLRSRALFSLPSIPLSLAAAVSAVHATRSSLHGTTPATVRSAAAAVRDGWKRPLVTSIFVYAILLAFAPVPRVIASSFASRFLVLAIGSVFEVYLMAVLGLGLVVSAAEERLGWEAIRVGSGLMRGRRVCGWLLSGLLVMASGLINGRVEELLLEAGQDSEMGIWDKTVLVCLYGLVVLFSYVITTVFYCDARRRHGIREPEEEEETHDDDDRGSLSSSL